MAKKKSVKKVGRGHVSYSGYGTHQTTIDKEEARRKKQQKLAHKVKRKEYEDI